MGKEWRTHGRAASDSRSRFSERALVALALVISSGACAGHGSTTLPQPASEIRPEPPIELGSTAMPEPIPVTRVAIMPVAGDAPGDLAEVFAASVVESLVRLAPEVELVAPSVAAELLATGRAMDARETAFAYEARSAEVDQIAADRITAAVGTPWIVDLRIDRIEMLEPRRGPEDPGRSSVPDALGARVTLWSSGDSEPAWGGVVLIPEGVTMADEGGNASATVRRLITRFMSRAPIVFAG